MSRVLSHLTLTSRLTIAVAVALVISSIVADLYGARLESTYSNTVPLSPGTSLFLGVAGLTSSGRVKIEVEGASDAYYVKLSGDPFMLVQQLRALNLNISASRPQFDLRAGVAYVVAIIQASLVIVQALSLLGEVIPAVQTGGSNVLIEVNLATGESVVAVIPTALEPTIKVDVSYTVEGYSRLTPLQATTLSFTLLLIVASLETLRRRRSPASTTS